MAGVILIAGLSGNVTDTVTDIVTENVAKNESGDNYEGRNIIGYISPG